MSRWSRTAALGAVSALALAAQATVAMPVSTSQGRILALEKRIAKLDQQVVDLFSRNPISAEWGGGGVYRGREGVIRKYGNAIDQGPKYGVFREHLQLQGVIHVAPDRQSAKARFRALAFWALSPNDPAGQSIQSGLYEIEYIREDGVWKINKLDYKQTMTAPWQDGWGKSQLFSACGGKDADGPTTWYHPYPEAGVFPLSLEEPRHWRGNSYQA